MEPETRLATGKNNKVAPNKLGGGNPKEGTTETKKIASEQKTVTLGQLFNTLNRRTSVSSWQQVSWLAFMV